MSRYVIKRIIGSIIAILGAATLVFFLMRISGDPVRLMMPVEASEAEIEAMRELLGFNDPVLTQYGRFIWSLLQGDLGTSLRYHSGALGLIVERLPATIYLAIVSIALATVIGVLAGTICAVKRNGIFDMIANFFVLIGQAVPVFWIAIIFILVFAVQLGWLPTSGNDGFLCLILPAVTLSLYPAATITRLTRSSLMEAMQEDYVRTAKAKGAGKRRIIFRHAMRNAFVPVLTVIGLEFGTLLGGAVVTETIFAWPGVGRLLIQAVYNSDFPLVQACVLVISTIFVVVNLLVDIGYSILDPRIRYD